DPKLRWPGDLSVGPDGIGNSPEYVKHIMEESMEALINHFKIVTEGYQVPAGEVYTPVESARGELGYYVVSDGGARPYRVRVRDPAEVTSTDGITLHEEECLGACEQAPVVTVNFTNYARMTTERVRELVSSLRGGEPPAPAPGAEPPGDLRDTSRKLAGLGAT